MKKINFGMPMLIETDTVEKCAGLCKELGLDFIELNMNLPQFQKEVIDIKNLRSIMESENIYYTIHLDEKLNVCDFDSEVAAAYTKAVLWAIDIAKRLNIPVLNMHMSEGVYFTLPSEKIFLFSKYKDIYLKRLKDFRELCEEAIGDSGIKICIENTKGFKDFEIEGIELLLESEVFALTLDIGHEHCSDKADESFFERHADRVIHMHVHDAKGNKDHLPLGEGEIDLKEKLWFASQQNRRVVLEVKTIGGLKKSVKKLNSYL